MPTLALSHRRRPLSHVAPQWKAVGVIEGDDVIIDFSAKGGPSDVKANFVLGKGLVFPDGNVWTKLS